MATTLLAERAEERYDHDKNARDFRHATDAWTGLRPTATEKFDALTPS